ncbi:MAG: HAD family phosphatase [Syntrophobacteraceae bacterium]|nr:HAD family phosphatase [Syntrophobacteraceae bacterium]
MSTAKSCPEEDLQAVIFDCDGVLVDTEPLHYQAFQKVLGPLGLGHDYARYLDRFVGFDDRDAFLYAFKEAGRELCAASLAKLIEEKSAALGQLIKRGAPGFPGVVSLVESLRERGVVMAVASGALRCEVEAFVSSLGLDGVFSAIVAANDVKKSKPDPETYRLAVERLSRLGPNPLDPLCCLAIEDTPAGIHSAKSAGLAVVAVTNSFPATELTGANKVVGSLLELNFQAMVELLKARRKEKR